ncbi:DUF1993 family protein [Duganella sp. BuS-21]|uniref:DUF1993 domain-containing protein n=1 Tax=Duganella sp. BuS-21 TaxID=2943848 RepID=UPI0035A65CEB
MSISMYAASVPVFKQLLGGLSAVLAKGEAYAEELHADAEVLLTARLYPNMFNLARQVLVATEFSKSCAARLAGLDVPKYEGVEGGFAEAQGRIAAVLAFLDTLTPEQINGSEDKEITYMVATTTRRYLGQPYLLHAVMPQFAFHVTTAYDILRNNGVKLQKPDYLHVY